MNTFIPTQRIPASPAEQWAEEFEWAMTDEFVRITDLSRGMETRIAAEWLRMDLSIGAVEVAHILAEDAEG